MSGILAVFARNGIWAAAILMSAGFFFAAAGRGVPRPNRLIVLLYLGMAALALGGVSLGIGLVTALAFARSAWRNGRLASRYPAMSSSKTRASAPFS